MESWMPYLIGVITLALVLQCIFLIAMFVAFRRASQRVEQIATELQGRINPILSRVQTLVDEVQPRIATLVNDVAEVTRVARTQAQHAGSCRSPKLWSACGYSLGIWIRSSPARSRRSKIRA